MGPLFYTMARRILFLLFLLVFALLVAKAQTWQQVYEEIMDVGETDDDASQALLDSYELLEHLAGRILNRLTDCFPKISYAELTVTKFNPPLDGMVESSSVTVVYE